MRVKGRGDALRESTNKLRFSDFKGGVLYNSAIPTTRQALFNRRYTTLPIDTSVGTPISDILIADFAEKSKVTHEEMLEVLHAYQEKQKEWWWPF